MDIEAVQYMRPSGRQIKILGTIDDTLKGQYELLRLMGGQIAMEVLQTGEVAVYLEIAPGPADTYDLQVVPNGPEVNKAVADMLRNFDTADFVKWKDETE